MHCYGPPAYAGLNQSLPPGGKGTCCHVIGVRGSTCTTTGCNGEVLSAVLITPLLVGSCNGVLESGGVGGVTGDGNSNVLKAHDRNALGNTVRAIALNLCSVTVRVCDQEIWNFAPKGF